MIKKLFTRIINPLKRSNHLVLDEELNRSINLILSNKLATNFPKKIVVSIIVSILFTINLETLSAQIVLDANTNSYAVSGNSITLSHTTGNTDNRLMLVSISTRSRFVSNVSYDGVVLDLVGSELSNADAYTYIFQLKDPSSGIANVVVNFTSSLAGNDGAIIGVFTFSNVDLTVNLNDKYFSAANSNSSPNVNLNSATGHLIFDVITEKDKILSSPGINQTQLLNIDTGGSVKGGSSTKSGSTSTSMSWNINAGTRWSMSALDLSPVPVSDLSILSSVSNNLPYKNTNVVFTFTAQNLGPQNAYEIEVENVLPNGYVFVSDTETKGIYNYGSGLWSIGNLAINETAILQITAAVNSSGNYLITNKISGYVNDNFSSNNSSNVSITVCKAGPIAPIFN